MASTQNFTQAVIFREDQRVVLRYYLDKLTITHGRERIPDTFDIEWEPSETITFKDAPEIRNIYNGFAWNWDDIFCLIAPVILSTTIGGDDVA